MQSDKTTGITPEKRYFAAANTGSGFKSFFDEIFRNLDKLYIIKGGPGTGKSKLLRDISNEAKNKSYDVEHFYCSSDPFSLDGIIIKELNTGIIDGTAPHMEDPVYPGAYDEIINLGDFWKSDRLVANKAKISAIINRKNEMFVSVYHYLSAADMINGELHKTINKAVLHDKLNAAAVRLVRDIKTGDKYRREMRLTDAIGMEGITHFNTFGELAEKRYIIKDYNGTADIFLNHIDMLLKEKRRYVQISCTPLNINLINGIYLPDLRTAFISDSNIEKRENDKTVNTERFVDHETVRLNRAKFRFGKRCRDSLTEGALDTLAEIKKLHSELEDIYIDAMDFRSKEEYTKKLLTRIFK
jgi:hypothetical protein